LIYQLLPKINRDVESITRSTIATDRGMRPSRKTANSQKVKKPCFSNGIYWESYGRTSFFWQAVVDFEVVSFVRDEYVALNL
jgi:hypothetical protein